MQRTLIIATAFAAAGVAIGDEIRAVAETLQPPVSVVAPVASDRFEMVSEAEFFARLKNRSSDAAALPTTTADSVTPPVHGICWFEAGNVKHWPTYFGQRCMECWGWPAIPLVRQPIAHSSFFCDAALFPLRVLLVHPLTRVDADNCYAHYLPTTPPCRTATGR